MNFYQVELETSATLNYELAKEIDLKNRLQVKLDDAEEKLNSRDLKDSVAKKLMKEKRNLEETCENRSLEVKHLKTDIENLKKENNILSVVLKGTKQELKEQEKAFTKEKDYLERNIKILNDFKTNLAN